MPVPFTNIPHQRIHRRFINKPLLLDSKPNLLVLVEVQLVVTVVPYPDLFGVVEGAVFKKVGSWEEDFVEKVEADVDALRGAGGDAAREEFTFEGPEEEEAEFD